MSARQAKWHLERRGMDFFAIAIRLSNSSATYPKFCWTWRTDAMVSKTDQETLARVNLEEAQEDFVEVAVHRATTPDLDSRLGVINEEIQMMTRSRLNISDSDL